MIFKGFLVGLALAGHLMEPLPNAETEAPTAKGFIIPTVLVCKRLEVLQEIVRSSQRTGIVMDPAPPQCGEMDVEPSMEQSLYPIEIYPLVENIPNLLSDVIVFKIVVHGRVLGYLAAARIVARGNAI